jgi:FAD/FMN-containing dehydrogenase/Fe-S oxidoreductase
LDEQALQSELTRTLDGDVRFDTVSRALYSTDASVYQIVPAGVVLPRSIDDLVRIVAIARRHRTAITMRGGGTSQAGQAIGAGIVVDTSKHLNRILVVNVEERWARVEPGVVLDHLNANLRPHGLRFAPDISTSSRATIGGMIANNSSGARSVMYGKTIDHVLELDVVLSDGSIAHLRPLDRRELDAVCTADSLEGACYGAVRTIAAENRDEVARRFPKVLRRVGGYNLDDFVNDGAPFNLSRIVVGSEGTLALVASAKVKLVPLPAAKAVMTIEFEELLDALAATPGILRHHPSAIEVMDRFILDHARENPALDAVRRNILVGDPGALLCVELYGDSPDDLTPRLDALERELQTSGQRCRWRRLSAAADQARVWSFREAALGLSMAMKGDDKSISFVEDTAVAPERLRDYIERFLQIIAAHGTSAGVYAHASVGCLHVRPVVNLKTAAGLQRFESIANAVSDLVLEFGGALSGEHGDGLVRGAFTRKMFGPQLYDAFRSIKRAFDPDGLFNPGRIVDTPRFTDNLRFGPGYETPNPETYFDYSDYEGLGRAVEMCSGLGVCRKTLDGTMCPSYMATREEKHSTRGRANTLRLAMSGRLGDARLGDEDIREVLDLCLECRACKAECPVGVDVARFKSEFLAGYWKRHGLSRRARAIGRIDMLSKWGSRFAPLSNVVARSGPARWAAEQLFSIDKRRTLPAWSRRTLRSRLDGTRRESNAARQSAEAHGQPAVLFCDTFTNHNHPEIGMDALRVLDAVGVHARVIPHVCCGRPLISQGLLDEARSLAAANADALHDAAASGQPIVFLEPSCLSSIREDAPALLRGDAQQRALVVARASLSFEELVERRCTTSDATMGLKSGPARVWLHGHCHQKAMGLLAPARALLSRIPSATVTDLDAGCCGMAGSFGYAKEHYEVSQQIAERRLLPAARAMSEGDVLVAPGISCRQQVAHFTGVAAVHPATLLRSLLR